MFSTIFKVYLQVAETGWPFKGDDNDVGPSIENAKAYTGSSLGMAGRLCCTASGEREVGGNSRIHVGKVERGLAAKGGREKRVLTAESFDTKLRIIRRLNLMVSQPFLYICVGQ